MRKWIVKCDAFNVMHYKVKFFIWHTCYHGKRNNAGEWWDVQIQTLQVGWKLHYGVDPVSKTSDTLQPMEDNTITKNEFALHWIGSMVLERMTISKVMCDFHRFGKLFSGRKITGIPVRQAQNKELQKRRFKEEVLIRFWEIREPWYLFGPTSYNTHGPSQQVVELLYVLRVIPSNMVVWVSLELEFN